MSITKRITKFLLIAALAIPAWSTASAQNRTAPPEGVAVKAARVEQTPKPFVHKRESSKLAGNRASMSKDICNGGATCSNVPIYCGYLDETNQGQMIYPADLLADLVGATITSITFHADGTLSRSSNSGTNNTSVTLKIGETQQAYFSSSSDFIDVSSFTSSCTMSTILNGNTEVTFNFTTPLIYNGGNLLLDMSCENPGDEYGFVNWKAQSQSNASLHKYGSRDAAIQGYLPYITIAYEPAITEPYYATLTGNGAFGEITKGTSKSATFTVHNRGTEAFTPQLVISQTETAFSVLGDMNNSLPSGETRNFTVTFTAAKVKEYTGTLTLSATESQDITASVPLSGTGVNAVTVADGSDGSSTITNDYVPVYGNYFENTATNDQIIYPASMLSGIDGKKIKSITFYASNGIKFGNPENTTYGTGDLKVTIGTTTDDYFSSAAKKDVANAVSQTITPEFGSTTMKITFDESFEYNSVSMGNIIIDTQVAESGAYATGTNWSGISTGEDYQSIYKGGSYGSYTRQLFLPKITFELETGVTINKTELDFGNVAVNTTSEAQTVTVSNSGDEAADLSWSFTNGKFSTTATVTSVPAGGQVEIPVTFAPTAVGSQEGTLTINAGDETFNVALSGNALVAYAATLEPQTIDFGAISVGGTGTVAVTLTNTGYNPITPTFTQPAAPFSVTGDSGELARGESRTYTVNFAPTAIEPYSGEFTIADADHNISYTVTLTGQGAQMDQITANSPVNFGSVNVGSNGTATVTFSNPNASNVSVILSTASPFSIPASASPLTIPANGTANVTVTFTPTAAISYIDTLYASVQGLKTKVVLKGVGKMSGPEAIRDKAFYDGMTYDWTDSEGSHTSKLSDIATQPEQIIAMLREVYTNKAVPGNLKRGCDENGNFTEDWSDVSYPAIGKIKWVGVDNYVDNLENYAWDEDDPYGWGISTSKDVIYHKNTDYSTNYPTYYTHFDQTEYQPDNEGVTLLLVEVADDYDQDTYSYPSTTGPQYLKDVISGVIKSVRIVTEAKRLGENQDRGTLFNVDCDKMNKFFFLAKGQLRMPFNSYMAYHGSSSTSYISSANFSPYPMYLYSSSYYGYGEIDKYVDYYNATPFYQMFEQFSPVTIETGDNIDDLYNSLVNMQDFDVVHDCITVPFATTTSETVHHGHQFMMYGVESGAADCQDVRDMMFFVPDYRMMAWDGRGSTKVQFTNYNKNHAPKMGLYVIKQDSVEAVTRADSYFKLKLTWDSNMDEFLPGEKQEYQLYEVFTDEFGVSKWVPVYKRNEQGQYWNPTTNAWQADTTGAERVVLTLDPSNTKKTYAEVYEMRENSGRIVTYAVRGQDTGHFLSLQMSNEESYFIPGTDPAEMALMSSATVYSRYEAQNENNCYSNKLLLKSSPRTIKASYLPNGSTMTINRTHRVRENGQSVEVTEPIATLTVGNGYFTVSGSVLDATVKDLFPKGTEDNLTAGYHANTLTNGNQIDYTTETVGGTEYMNFDIALWDNFVADVSENNHPGLYTYQLKFTTAESFEGLHGTTNEAYSNIIPVLVYKTDSQINEPLTLEQVNGDTGCSDAYKPGDVEFSAQVMLSSKSEILRYDAYRWNEGAERSIVDYGGETDEDEEDYDPNGIAGNQGDAYSVTMNAIGTDDYYVGSAVPVSTDQPQNWAKFVDYYPAKLVNGGAFTYAPVVELFTRGYVEGTTKERGDYNTYGGPLKTTAVGKIELEIPDNLNTAGNPFMSTYKWFDGSNWCAYYKIPVKFKVLGIPEGYELYKIRAWRDVDTNILREELSSRQDRIAANYLFEELTYGDALGDGHTMSKANLYQNNDGTVNSYELGRRAVENYDAESNIQGETHATFGALRINTKDNQPYAIDNLEATIKVRAYFTKTSNPILSDPIYVIGDNGNGWDYDNPLGVLTCEDGANFTGTVTVPKGSDGSGKGYFMFSKQLGSSWSNNPQYIFGPETSGGNEVLSEYPNNAGYNLKYWQSGTKVFEAYPGTYQLSIGSHVQDLGTSEQYNYQAGYIRISRTTAKAPSRELTPADFGYYVADGEVEFNSNMFNQIITGVTDVTMNGNREVMSVSYVNTIGQVSSTPWKGVNMVVTRYTDGSTSTTKVMK